MNYLNKFKTLLFTVAILAGLVSCEDFLDRPDKSSYELSEFYKNDEQILQAVNFLYNSPWHDFSRAWIGVGDQQSGNHYQSSNGYWLLAHQDGSTMDELESMSASLWSVNAHANTVMENIDNYASPETTEAVRNTAKGEALVWKAMAYFFMVRVYGAVPIVHKNSELMETGEYNTLFRAKVENVYDYIIMTLEKAVEWLPEQNLPGRIDRYSAYGLLSKVYLTKSGFGRSGDRNQADLDKAKEYAYKVIHESGRELETNYEDIFRGSKNFTRESLLSWRWVSADNWTCGNPIKSDMAAAGFDEFGSDGAWGSWRGPSLDLQAAFGEDAFILGRRQNLDKRRKATMMMYGDVYPYFWRDHPIKDKINSNEKVNFSNGFDFTLFYRDVLGGFHSPTGANAVKHIPGDQADHIAELGMPMAGEMVNGLATHLLRLGDIYLIYAEAILGNSASTTDGEALYAFNEVRKRAYYPDNAPLVTSLTFEDIFKERRLELAYEGDFWYDFVRLSYYKPEEALAKLNSQNRKIWSGITGYQFDGIEGRVTVSESTGLESPRINEETVTGQPYPPTVFTMPFPRTDYLMNPNLLEPPVDYDLSQFKY